jgi:recombination protein RecA
VAPPFRQAEFDILYNEGISREGDLLDIGVDCGVVEKSGAWYSYGGERVGQGRDAARRFLKENPDLRERLAEAVYAARGVKRGVPVEGALEGSEVEAPEAPQKEAEGE